MVNYEKMRALIACPNKESLMETVNKLTAEDATMLTKAHAKKGSRT